MKNRLLGLAVKHQVLVAAAFATALMADQNLRAESSFYLGGTVWQADWNVGVTDKQSDNAANGAPVASSISSAALALGFPNASNFRFTTAFFNTPANAVISTAGIFGAYNFGSAWSLSFNLTHGATDFRTTRNSIFVRTPTSTAPITGFSSGSTTNHRVDVGRQDFDFVVSRRFADSPVSVFGGVKFQQWSYTTSSTIGAGVVTFTYQQNSASSVTSGSNPVVTNFAYDYTSRMAGPAAGLSYNLAIDKEQALTAQVGAVYLFGSLKMTESNSVNTNDITLNDPSGPVSIPGTSFGFRDKLTDKLEMPGYTAALSYRRSVGETVSIRIGFFYQELTVKSTDPKDTGLTVFTYKSSVSSPATLVVFPATSRRVQPKFSVDGAREIFRGMMLSVTTRIW